jgi:TPR repeat protein
LTLLHFHRTETTRYLVVSKLFILLFAGCDTKPESDQVLLETAPPANVLPPASSPGTDDLEFLRLQAEEGFQDKQYQYAYYLTIYQQQPSDLVLAKDWFTKAAEQGHLEACYRLGVIYSVGLIDGTANLHEATKWFLKAATRGHSGAQFELGKYCLQGEGVIKSAEKAKAWLQLAAHQYHSGAQFMLGRMYETGNGVSPDLELSFKWYKLAADSGYPAALYKAAEMAENGIGTESNKQLAKNWYTQAHAQGLPGKFSDPKQSSVASSSQAIQTGASIVQKKVPSDDSNAGPAGPTGTPSIALKTENESPAPTIKAISTSAPIPSPEQEKDTDLNNEKPAEKVFIEPTKASIDYQNELKQKKSSAAEVEYRIAENYSKGETIPANPEKALDYYQHSALKGNPQALHKIGMEFLNPPQSQVPDYPTAISYFEKAAAKGHSPSQFQLAEIFYKGDHDKPNYNQAFIWYRLAANNQIPEAQYRLGSMYFEGIGVEQNTVKAKNWLHLAASQNNQAAITLLHRIHQKEQNLQNKQPDLDSSTSQTPSNRSDSEANLSAPVVDPPLTLSSTPSPQTPEDWLKKGLQIYNSQKQPSSKTYLEAYECFVRAANANLGDAWYYIGKMYDYGEGLKANPVKAFECYLVSAREGNPNAQYSLGFMYETGLGCSKNPTEAYVWYAIAAENGLPNAHHTRNGLENKMSVGEIGYARQRLITLQEYLRKYQSDKASRLSQE